jgi:hypothetical protein
LKATSYRVEIIEAPTESNLTVAAVAIWRHNTSQEWFLHRLSSKKKTTRKRLALTGTQRNAGTET